MIRWKNKSPGDLSIELPEVTSGDVDLAIVKAQASYSDWRENPLDTRCQLLKQAQAAIDSEKETLARQIAIETGKPIKEAIGEIGAVIAKIDLAISDARKYLAEESAGDNAHPNLIRRRPRGVAGVIGPFNFPIHLAHGAITAYLLAGNTVVFKPSPLAANVCGHYGRIMSSVFGDVFQLVQGGAKEGQRLVCNTQVRSICFTGSVTAGKAIAKAVVEDVGKDVALELGGKNALLVCSDADLKSAASAVAEAMCLTAGQRCNSTSRVIVDRSVENQFIDLLRENLVAFVPGNPLDESTRLGPLISEASRSRYQGVLDAHHDWIIPGGVREAVDGKMGYYVLPAVARLAHDPIHHPLFSEEIFSPIVSITSFAEIDEGLRLINATPFGLTTSIFTADRERFLMLSSKVDSGNVYHNLPTTFSPSTLPFGGLKESGNRRPGGRGFVRFAADEQVLQMKA